MRYRIIIRTRELHPVKRPPRWLSVLVRRRQARLSRQCVIVVPKPRICPLQLPDVRQLFLEPRCGFFVLPVRIPLRTLEDMNVLNRRLVPACLSVLEFGAPADEFAPKLARIPLVLAQ